jgi:hypothetical protein
LTSDQPNSLTEQAAAAFYLGIPTGEVSKKHLDRFLKVIRDATNANADRVGRFLCDYVTHLSSVGCSPDDVPGYIRLEQRVLASLYYLARQLAPSPMEMRQLALRSALDARRPVTKDLSLFAWQHTAQGWTITAYPSRAHRAVPLPPPGGVTVVRDPRINAILDCVLVTPPNVPRLMGAIEQVFGRIPRQTDTLEALELPTFTYAICTDNGYTKIGLWINGQFVALPRQKDIHNLLALLCQNPRGEYHSRRLLPSHSIRNASQAAKTIRKALEKVFPGAAAWLQTCPLCWVEGHSPTLASLAV